MKPMFKSTQDVLLEHFGTNSVQCAARMFLLSEKLMSCCAAGTMGVSI